MRRFILSQSHHRTFTTSSVQNNAQELEKRRTNRIDDDDDLIDPANPLSPLHPLHPLHPLNNSSSDTYDRHNITSNYTGRDYDDGFGDDGGCGGD
jgi:hypothetical protein